MSTSFTIFAVGSHSRSAACGVGSTFGTMAEMTMIAATATLCATIETTTTESDVNLQATGGRSRQTDLQACSLRGQGAGRAPYASDDVT